MLAKSEKAITRLQKIGFWTILNCPQHFRGDTVVSAVRALKIFEDKVCLVHSLRNLRRVVPVIAGSHLMTGIKG